MGLRAYVVTKPAPILNAFRKFKFLAAFLKIIAEPISRAVSALKSKILSLKPRAIFSARFRAQIRSPARAPLLPAMALRTSFARFKHVLRVVCLRFYLHTFAHFNF